jgi:hypothetical protein
MSTLLNTIIMAILQIPDNVKAAGVILSYLLMLACLTAIESLVLRMQKRLDKYKGKDWRYDG